MTFHFEINANPQPSPDQAMVNKPSPDLAMVNFRSKYSPIDFLKTQNRCHFQNPRKILPKKDGREISLEARKCVMCITSKVTIGLYQRKITRETTLAKHLKRFFFNLGLKLVRGSQPSPHVPIVEFCEMADVAMVNS